MSPATKTIAPIIRMCSAHALKPAAQDDAIAEAANSTTKLKARTAAAVFRKVNIHES